MNDLLPFVVSGLATGAVYGMTATGLVLTYKTSGIFNLAHGALAAAGAYSFYELRTVHGLPWPLALALCLLVVAPLSGTVLYGLTRGLAGASTAAKLVATVGLLLAVQGLLVAAKGASNIYFPPFLPTGTFRVLGVNVGFDQLIVTVVAATAAGGLFCFFRVSRLGIAMRAAVDNRDLLGLQGTSAARVLLISWMVGSCFAALSGILLAPSLGLDAVLLTLLAVQAYGAAAIGRFSSLPLTFAGGLLIGVAADLSKRFVADVPALAGLPASLPFIVLFAVLLFTPRGKLVETRAFAARRAADHRPFPRPLVLGGRVATLVGLLAIPHVVGPRLPVFTSAVIFVVIFASLRLLVRTSGQVSLCHAGFAAVGATSFSHLVHGAGLPWLVALVGAGVVTIPLGAVVAIPAIRLSGLYLALATLGFGIFLERMAYSSFLLFGGSGGRPAPRPEWLSTDTGFYYACLAVAVVAVCATLLLPRLRLGQLLRALADSPLALATNGTNVNVTRVLAFCLSAFLAGMAGALLAAQAGVVTGVGFAALNSLVWLAVLAISGPGEVVAPLLAAALLVVAPSYLSSPGYLEAQPVLFGVAAMAAALLSAGNFDFASRLSAAQRRARRSPVTERCARRLEPARGEVPA
ncbi:MAG: hypothetical protein QOJ23_3843 [Actinomycetota bacterium]|nr:hypothetical protein [Actinomycetota bacterium]